MPVTLQKRIDEMTAGELIRHILATHHAFLKQELPRMEGLFDKAAAGPRDLSAARETFRELKAELEQHLMKEEVILFPYILRLEQAALEGEEPPAAGFGSVRNPIRMMELEHERASAALRSLRAFTSDYQVPDSAPAQYRSLMTSLAEFDADLETHVRLENDLLHPRAAALES